MIKKMSLAVLLLLASMSLNAQVVSTLAVETRVDEQGEFMDGDYLESASGFVGKFFNFRMAGNLTDELSYSIRHRINRPQTDGSLFQATDWAYLTYSKDNWNLSAGKQVVAIGGYEYDRAPINIYFGSEYWNNIACYQFGLSAGYALGEKDNLTLQVCQSPLGSRADNLKALNLMWCGSHGSWNTIYSLNFMQSTPDRMVNYIVLGNRFGLGDVAVEFDFMNRASLDEFSVLENFSVMADVKWSVNEKLDLFGKVTYDQNTTNDIADGCVLPGSKLTRVGGGVEYFPFGGRDVRLHAAASYVMGESVASVLAPKSLMFNVGLTWRINLLAIN